MASVDGAGLPVYSVYGIKLASDFPFTFHLSEDDGPPDLSFRCVAEPPIDPDWEEGATPVYATSPRRFEQASSFYLYRLAGCEIVRYTGRAHFYLWPDRIECHLLDPRFHFAVQIWLLGGLLAYWLEHRGIPALHASAVAIDDQVVAFLASNKGGKSSLVAGLMRLGHPLLTDDILPLEERDGGFVGLPSYPQMRMWPDEAQHFVGDFEGLQKVQPALSKRVVPVGPGGFGRFCGAAPPIRCIYVPERLDDEAAGVTITGLSLKEAMVELVRHSFLPRVVAAAGLEAQRFHLFASLIRQVPVRRLRYPSGLEQLPRVAEAVLDDLAESVPLRAAPSHSGG